MGAASTLFQLMLLCFTLVQLVGSFDYSRQYLRSRPSWRRRRWSRYRSIGRSSGDARTEARSRNPTCIFSSQNQEQISVQLSAKLTDEKVKQLFAWISRAFAGDVEYNDLMLAMAAVFGTNLKESSLPMLLLKEAMAKTFPSSKNEEEECCMGQPLSLYEREHHSMYAMGAGQWTGQWKTRPHALLNIKNCTCIEEWRSTLPRGCKRTLKKVDAAVANENFTVVTKTIFPHEPAPHSSLSHFQCVVEHEVRLITADNNNIQDFFYALQEAVGRYMGTTRMAGEIQEYRNREGKVIAFAHEIAKARTIRGQWFYSTDEASKAYVWFHSVQELVRRAIETPEIDVVDLGPSGSDAFSALKERYGFESVEDWPSAADYVSGPFRHAPEVLFKDWEAGQQRQK